MNTWEQVVQEVLDVQTEFFREGSEWVFYRGHGSHEWQLLPSLARWGFTEQRENNLYYSLRTQGGHLILQSTGPWTHLFLMQHHRFPTRLLDWTESFAVALYFALVDSQSSEGKRPTVWILNAAKLNYLVQEKWGVAFLDTDYPIGYESYFANDNDEENYGKFPDKVVALYGDASNARLRAQQGAFTLHRDLDEPLEKMYPRCVRKIEIPLDAIEGASEFLHLAGIDAFRLFPDLDTLGGQITAKVFRESHGGRSHRGPRPHYRSRVGTGRRLR